MIGYFRFALIAMLLAGIACVSAVVTMQFAVHRAEVTVPDLRALPVNEAVGRAAALGLDLSVKQRFYSTVLPAGQVLLQSPAAGATVRRGWNVAVAESLGPDRIPIPNVVGKSERSAILLIRQRGLELGTLAYLPDQGFPAGTVVAQNPDAQAKGAEQPSVSLLLTAPLPEQTPAWVMPDVQGRLYKEAAAEFAKAGLKVASSASTTPSNKPGEVVSQSPLPGARVDASTPIVLSISAAKRAPRKP